ncbi:MAG: hypothetical protein KatS3mg104_1734 [Phycisphaerae bacterium]|jgi:hypothetical protein|nr:MAG: hypothetical protein KatS3mg104_1734 [Phycisphaerae bacterium]
MKKPIQKKVTYSPQTLENLENRRLLAAVYDIGININDGTSNIKNKAIPVLKELGVKTVRVWFSPNFKSKSWEGPLQRALDYSNAGFDVMMIISTPNGQVTNASDVKSWFTWALGNSSLKNAVDRWQIGNEVDKSQYWKGSLSSYVTNFLKPASEVLRSKGEKVVSASVSWNPNDVATMIGYGMLNYVDFVGYHPYGNSISQIQSRVKQINDIVAGRKPIIASEWNVRGYENNKTEWAKQVRSVAPIIRDGFAYNYYFAVLNTTRTPAGPAGVMNSDGTKTDFFYKLKEGMSRSSGSDNTGNESSAIPSVAKITVYAEDGTKIIDSLTSGSIIDLSKYSSRKLTFVATVSSGTSSVRLVIGSTGVTENNAPYQLSDFAVYSGSYALSATPYSKDNLGGTKGSTRTYTFKVINSPSTSSSSTGTISGYLWNDTDGDGVVDSNESRTGSRTVFIDANRNGKLDSGEKSTVSDSQGNYKFTGLSAGTYYVSRLYPSGYRMSNSSTGYVTVNLSAGENQTGVLLGTTNQSSISSQSSSNSSGTITGVLWNDDGDGIYEAGEKTTGIRTVFLDANRNGRLDPGERSTQSDKNGKYVFSSIPVGTHYVSRVFPSGFKLSNDPRGYLGVYVTSGQTTVANLGTTYK